MPSINGDLTIDTITIAGGHDDYYTATATDVINVGDINLAIDGSYVTTSPTWTWQDPTNEIIIGDNDTDKQKIYIVEPWQSRKPIKVKDGLWVSLEQDLISNDEIKKQILEKIEDEHPDLAIKMGLNSDNIKLVKSEVNLEINKELK